MPAVECITLHGHKRMVREEGLVLRPAAYAIVVHDGKVLLLRLGATGKYHLPGGGVKTGERIRDTLKRELVEETGIEIEVGKLAHFEELFFCYDPSDTAYHGLHFYYICKPKTSRLLGDDQVDDESAEKPRWVDIQSLQAQDFQIHGDIILDLCRTVAAST